MFDNVGYKIQRVAKWLCWISIAFYALGGFGTVISGLAEDSTEGVLAGFVLMIFGPLISWIGSLLLYGFGQLIENTGDLVEVIYDEKIEEETRKKNENT